MGNLIDNACKFARSEISVDIKADVDNLYLKIEDDGPGVKAEQLQAITVKGTRLDENVQGHGLGLSICSDIVRSYHGSLLFNASDLGGLKVEVVIPLRLL
jgi:signal transduction histidine kinase